MEFGKEIIELKLGDRATFEKTIYESDVYLFAELIGNHNPIHIDEEQAEKTKSKEKIVNGMMVSGLISACMATYLPGPGMVCLEQQIKFLAPVYIGDRISVEVEVFEINIEENRLNLRTICTNQHGGRVIDGQALVAPYKKDIEYKKSKNYKEEK